MKWQYIDKTIGLQEIIIIILFFWEHENYRKAYQYIITCNPHPQANKKT